MFLRQYLDEARVSVRNLDTSHENTQKTQKVGEHGLRPRRQGIEARNITFSWRRLLSNVAVAMINLVYHRCNVSYHHFFVLRLYFCAFCAFSVRQASLAVLVS